MGNGKWTARANRLRGRRKLTISYFLFPISTPFPRASTLPQTLSYRPKGPSMAPVRFIVTGLGSFGPSWAELIQKQDGAELAAVVEPMDDRRASVVEARGLRADQAFAD